MATQNFETLRARVQALGFQLFMDDSCDGTVGNAKSLGEDGPRFYVHDPKKDRHVIIGTGLDIEEWIVEKEDITEPAAAEESSEDPESDEPTARALLGKCWHHLHGIEQIAAMLYDSSDQTEEAAGAAHVIRHLAATAYGLIDTAKDRMGVQVTPAVIAMSERLRKLGYKLLADATAADIFSVISVRPGPEITWHLFIVSLDEIDDWIKRERLEGGAA